MPAYVVEVYLSRLHGAALGELTARLRRASEDLERAGTSVVYVRSVFLPEDETCFHFFEAASLEAIRESCPRLGLAHGRITTATSLE
jgi:hypothetical protein